MIATAFFLSFFYLGFAQNLASPIAGARGAGMANASLTFADIHSIFANQAGLAFVKKTSAMAASERRFNLSHLSTFLAAVAVPTRSGTFGLAVHYFGFDAFNEQKIGLAYARKLLKNFSIGLQFDYLNTKVAEYGSKGVLTFELGFLLRATKKIQLATHLFNPARTELANGENLPTTFSFGGSFRPSEKVVLVVEVEKDISFDARVKAGIEYQVVEEIFLRTGISTEPAQASFGLGFKIKNGLKIDVASSYHQVLGYSPSVGLSFQFK